ncbi:MAG: hypothetical protein JWM27_3110 [Gemmatimonadetes bacterium]|nr:hypothetical protein [Gemmatimonadota bacterium]
MMRASLLLAGAALIVAVAPAAAQERSAAVQFSDHAAGEHVATGYLPGGMVYPGGAVDGAQAPALEREVTFTGPVDMQLVGVTANNQLTLWNPQGQAVAARVRCLWADAGSGARTWVEFNCFHAGAGAPPPQGGGLPRTVVLRAFVVVDGAQTSAARAGRYSGTAAFRVDAM